MTSSNQPTEMYRFQSVEAFNEFKRLYALADAACEARGIDTKDSTFIFDSREWVVGYAKYVIEYIEMRLKE